MLEAYGFVPDMSASVHLNARRVLGETPTALYFSRPNNLAFHDLTKGRSIPPATAEIMGLGTKFVPTPERTSGRQAAEKALERFERDLGWKVFWAGKPSKNKFKKSKLYTKSAKHAKLPPRLIDTRLCRFRKVMLSLYQK